MKGETEKFNGIQKRRRKRTQEERKIAWEFHFCSQFFITMAVVYFYEMLAKYTRRQKQSIRAWRISLKIIPMVFFRKTPKFSWVHNHLDVEKKYTCDLIEMLSSNHSPRKNWKYCKMRWLYTLSFLHFSILRVRIVVISQAQRWIWILNVHSTFFNTFVYKV